MVSCANTSIVLGMTHNEIALVVFLFVLITSWGVLPRLGEWMAIVTRKVQNKSD